MTEREGTRPLVDSPSRRDERDPLAALVDAAARRFVAAGRFALHFARGKLRHDPIFFALLRQGLIPDGVRVLDLGCGQGTLFAFLLAARQQHRAGAWPAGWPAPPSRLSLRGIELRAADVRRARLALEGEAEIEQGDLRTVALAPSDLILLLDVLHYLDPDSQDRLLARIADALGSGGMLLLRVGDVTARVAALLTRVVDYLVTAARGRFARQFHRRTVPQWVETLERLGFAVSAEPMSEGTPFANVLLVARRIR